MNVIVLAGGYSSERDVSLVSGSNVVRALRNKGHNVLLLDPYKDIDTSDSFQDLYTKYAQENYEYTIPASEPDLVALKQTFGNGDNLLGKNILETCKLSDVVFIGLHGSFGENGQLQAVLELFDVRYTGSDYLGCLLSMDKTVAKEIMRSNGIRTPQSEELIISDIPLDKLYAILDSKELPIVIKPCNGGSSLGVTIVRTKENTRDAIKYVKTYESKILVEDYITGREFTVGILDKEALPVIEIRPKNEFFDYKSKYQNGQTDELCPAPISEELSEKLKSIALKAHKALRLGDYSRADFIVNANNEIYCLEVNSLPGLTPASLVPKEANEIGLGYEDLCEKIIKLAIKRKTE